MRYYNFFIFTFTYLFIIFYLGTLSVVLVVSEGGGGEGGGGLPLQGRRGQHHQGRRRGGSPLRLRQAQTNIYIQTESRLLATLSLNKGRL